MEALPALLLGLTTGTPGDAGEPIDLDLDGAGAGAGAGPSGSGDPNLQPPTPDDPDDSDFELVDEATFRVAPCVAPGLRLGSTVLGGKQMTGLFATRRFDKCEALGAYTGTPMLSSDFDNPEKKIAGEYAYEMKTLNVDGTKLSFVIVPPLGADDKVDLKKYPLAAMNEPPPRSVANVVVQQMIVPLEQMQKTGAPSDVVEPLAMLVAFTTRRVGAGEQLYVHYGDGFGAYRYYPVGNQSSVQCSNDVRRLFPSGVPWSCVVHIPRDLLADEEDSR